MGFLNFVLFFIPLLYFYKQKKSIVAIYIVAIWTFSALVGIFYNSSEYKREGFYNTETLPFIYLAVCLYISLYPLLKQKDSVKEVSCSTPLIEWIIIGIAVLAYEPFLEMVYNLIDFVISGRFYLLGANYDDFASQESESLIHLTKWAKFLCGYFRDFKVATLILFFYYLKRPYRKKWVLIGLFMASIIPMLFNICIGSKTEAIFYVVSFIGFYLLLKDIYAKETLKLLRKLIVGISSTAFAVALALSIGRYVVGSNYGDANTSDFLVTYTAESMYNFNENAFHENKKLYGFATMQPVLLSLGITNVSMDDRRDYIRTQIQSPAHLFYNYIGDFVLDWGLVGAILIILTLSIIFSKVKIGEDVSLSNLFLFGIYVYMLFNGLFYFCYKSTWGPIYANLFLFVVTRLFEKKKSR